MDIQLVTQIIGWMGTVATSICFLPQLIKVIKTRNTEDLSFFMLTAIVISSALWIAYGVLDDNNMQVWITNVFQIVFTLIIWNFKVIRMVKTKQKTKKVTKKKAD